MKRYIKKITMLALFSVIMSCFMSVTAQASTADANIAIDGYYDDWAGLPYSWEYNWDNPYRIENYWDGTKNITKEYLDENGNPYNLEIRHKMSLYCDGTYVYLHIEMATNYNAAFNGECYEFYVDGDKAQYRLTYAGGDNIHKNDGKEPGIYPLEIRHGNSALSGNVVNGAYAVYTKKPNDLNNEMELRIPLSALAEQNHKIDIHSFNTISFFTPNLMYRRISCAGTSTGPFAGVAVCSLLAGGAVVMGIQKKKGSKL